MSKIYFCGMSGPKSLENLEELILPIIDHVDGLVWVLHDSRGTEEDKFLEAEKKGGRIIHANFCRRHDFSRNHYLYCGPIKNGDWVISCDDLERINSNFTKNLKSFIQGLKDNNINFCYYYGKPFLFEYHESLVYHGNPHEGLHRLDGKISAIELNQFYPTEKDVRYNVRPIKRPDPFHWVNHYLKYYLYPFGANHCLLGLSDRGDPNKLFPVREKIRLEFLEEMENRGFEKTVDGFNRMFCDKIDEKLKYFLNNEKIIQDAYLYNILKDTNIIDEHRWTMLRKF